MTTELRFPTHIDNSIRKELVKCQKIANWKFEYGLNAIGSNVHLVAGTAFAAGLCAARSAFYADGHGAKFAVEKGLEALYKSYGSFVPPANENKTAARMAGAFTYYMDKHPLELEMYRPLQLKNKWAVEMYASYPMGVAHPDTGNELEYCGNFDMLAMGPDSRAWIVDEKTTGQLGDKWANQWDLDSQMTGYCWIAKRILEENNIDMEVGGAVINGVAIKKYDYDSARCLTMRQPWEIDRWFKQIQKDVQGWKIAYQLQNHNQVLDHACALYNNPCAYAKLCKSANPERIIDGNYVVKFWNPLNRDGD